MTKIAPIALTPGEPGGIGPDLCIQMSQTQPLDTVVVIADSDLLMERAEELKLALTIIPFDPDKPIEKCRLHEIRVAQVPLKTAASSGLLTPENAEYVLETLRHACDGCLSGEYSALVTGPVHKGIINEANIPFTGHTEFLADRCKAHPVMMLATPGLRVALATTHLPLSEVSHHITQESLEQVMRILHTELVHRFGLKNPKILVCGLNPHAGEGGHLGTEEISVIQPVLDKLRSEDMNLIGPLPADTLFTPPFLEQADAVLAMYHDQGLPVLKHIGFGHAVNITLGLPIIRTSVDHGTALDLAGTGKASISSLKYALQVAEEMAIHRKSGEDFLFNA